MNNLNVFEVAAIATLQLKREVSKNDIANALGVTRQYIWKIKDDPLSQEQLLKIATVLGVKFELDEKTIENREISNRCEYIPYWDGCPVCAERIKDNQITSLLLDSELIINKLNCEPSALKIIAMPGEEMNGGVYPIRNGDILLIDTSKTDLTESGVFFITTQNCTKVLVRRLLETMTGDVFSSCDNPMYKEIVDKMWSREELEEMDFKVIGKVIKNMSYTI